MDKTNRVCSLWLSMYISFFCLFGNQTWQYSGDAPASAKWELMTPEIEPGLLHTVCSHFWVITEASSVYILSSSGSLEFWSCSCIHYVLINFIDWFRQYEKCFWWFSLNVKYSFKTQNIPVFLSPLPVFTLDQWTVEKKILLITLYLIYDFIAIIIWGLDLSHY